jgi:hypothetical protein
MFPKTQVKRSWNLFTPIFDRLAHNEAIIYLMNDQNHLANSIKGVHHPYNKKKARCDGTLLFMSIIALDGRF